jgi:hypothetical protein
MKLNDMSRFTDRRSERLDRESGDARLSSRADVSESATKTRESLEFVEKRYFSVVSNRRFAEEGDII